MMMNLTEMLRFVAEFEQQRSTVVDRGLIISHFWWGFEGLCRTENRGTCCCGTMGRAGGLLCCTVVKKILHHCKCNLTELYTTAAGIASLNINHSILLTKFKILLFFTHYTTYSTLFKTFLWSTHKLLHQLQLA